MGAKRAKERKKADKPSFDETALAQLTSKIDKSLGDSEKERPPKRKRHRDNDDEHDSKRHHHARLSESNPQGDPGSRRQNKQASTLLDEILALGGNEDDLDLVANVDSGDEGGEAPRPKVSSEPIADKSLRDELAQFASTLGFSKFRENEDPETDEDSDVVEEAPNNSAGEESEAEEEDIKPTPQPQEARQGKQSGKSVSKQLCAVFMTAGTENRV
jgi:ribosome biogenesis protein MAK21